LCSKLHNVELLLESVVRVLIALQYYLPHRTGYTLHVQRVAEGLAARGHNITVMTACHLPDLPAQEIIAGVKVIRLAAPIRISRGAVMPSYLWHAVRLARQMDTIWINTPLLETALWGLIAKALGKRLVITHHGDLRLTDGFFNRFIEWFIFQNFRIGSRSADAIVGYSEDYAAHSQYLRQCSGKLIIISPPIAIPPANVSNTAVLRARLAPQGGPIIGFAGRFVQEKRPDLLLRATLTLRHHYPNLRVVFAGEHKIAYENMWEQCSQLVAEIGDAAIFLGMIDKPNALADFYAACDVLALPSEGECFALVQAEAMLSGTPVVASDIPGARIPVRITGMGLLFESGNVDALTAALYEVLMGRAKFVAPAGQIAGTFSLARTLDAYESVLEPRS
jgi:glycosyltransferase involved in cell wall biosynthesis